MFAYKKELDKTFEKEQTHYWLTQGDSCTIYATPKKDGELIDFNLIEKALFKIGQKNTQGKVINKFTKEIYADNNHYVLKLTPDESGSLPIGKYIYEFEYTLTGGEINTPNRWLFEITDQNVE